MAQNRLKSVKIGPKTSKWTKSSSDNFFSDNGYQLPDDALFLESGIVDSTGVLELVMFVEETFGATVEDQEIVPENFDPVAQLAAYIRCKVA